MIEIIAPQGFTESEVEGDDAEMEWRRRLIAIRNQAGLSQAQLGERAGIGQSTIAKWETKGFPRIDQFLQLAEALGVTASELAGDVPGVVESRPSPEERAILAVVRGQELKLEEAVRRLSRPIGPVEAPLRHPIDVTHEMPEVPESPSRRKGKTG